MNNFTKSKSLIKFNNPFVIGKEIGDICKTIDKKELTGPENYIKKCETLIMKQLNCKKALLTSSATDALEMACILANFKKDDEIIIPSFNFPSSAIAVIRCGAKPIFVNVKEKDLNICIEDIENSITKKTKGIIVVHYAGHSCDMKEILSITKKYSLILIEDAAHAIYSKYYKRYLGTLGHFGVLSFHQTKNVFCGEGGALIVNKKKDFNRSDVIREKGTNRNKFVDGKVSKYSWVDNGSSFLPSSLQAAFLYSQLKKGNFITRKRRKVFWIYDKFFKNAKLKDIFLPYIGTHKYNNGHFYWILIPKAKRDYLIKQALAYNIELSSHYEPLHNSLAGKKYGKSYLNLKKTEGLSKRLLRLPIHTNMKKETITYIINVLKILINK